MTNGESLYVKDGVTLDGGRYRIWTFKKGQTIYLEGNVIIKDLYIHPYDEADCCINALNATNATVSHVLFDARDWTFDNNIEYKDTIGIIYNCGTVSFDEECRWLALTEPKVEICNPEVEPSLPSCANEKDSNCDGIITCDEVNGTGWTWNNELKECEYNDYGDYKVVNTVTK